MRFEPLNHGKTCDTTAAPSQRPTGEDIDEEGRVKDLGVTTSEKLNFGEQSSNEWSDHENVHDERHDTDGRNI